jgi:hypothetical protein
MYAINLLKMIKLSEMAMKVDHAMNTGKVFSELKERYFGI